MKAVTQSIITNHNIKSGFLAFENIGNSFLVIYSDKMPVPCIEQIGCRFIGELDDQQILPSYERVIWCAGKDATEFYQLCKVDKVNGLWKTHIAQIIHKPSKGRFKIKLRERVKSYETGND